MKEIWFTDVQLGLYALCLTGTIFILLTTGFIFLIKEFILAIPVIIIGGISFHLLFIRTYGTGYENNCNSIPSSDLNGS